MTAANLFLKKLLTKFYLFLPRTVFVQGFFYLEGYKITSMNLKNVFHFEKFNFAALIELVPNLNLPRGMKTFTLLLLTVPALIILTLTVSKISLSKF